MDLGFYGFFARLDPTGIEKRGGTVMKPYKAVCFIRHVLRLISARRKRKRSFVVRSCRSVAGSSLRAEAIYPVQIGQPEALEERMLLSGTSALEEPEGPVLHVLPVATKQVEPAPAALEGLTVNAPLSDTFSLSSNPNAKKTIYLDFTGNVTSGTYWNYGRSANLVTDPFSIDSDPAFNNTELQRIQNIWLRVAEDFIPFDVNVTTAEPPQSDLIKSGYADDRWGIRVAIGGRYQDWYGNSAGGVAYLNSFNWSTDTPTFVFSETLYNSEKYVAEAISHEVGHTLNLSHDGTSSLGYYTGHGSGSTGWAPIMGVGYYRELTQWSKGEYSGANQTQDDLNIITTNNGFGYRADDYGNSLNNATDLSMGQNNAIIDQQGIIERNTDTDWFSFTTTGGAINLSIDPFVLSPNLDILAELYNSSGQLVLSSNPATTLDATLATTLAAGTYYVKIDGIGKGSPATGYSDYGSLGQYTISGTIEGASINLATDAKIVGFENGNWWVSTLSSGSWQTTLLGSFPVSTLKSTLTGDFNGDGIIDVAGWATNGNWYLGITQSNNTLAVTQWTGWLNNDASQVHVGDFNGDGKDDLLAMDSSGYWWVAQSQGNTFTTGTWTKWKASANWKDVQVADFNNDGKDDIIGRARSGRLTVALSTGTKFTNASWGQWSKAVTWQDVSVGDFNGDGRADIVGRANSGIWRASISQGNSFSTSSWKKWATSGSWNDVVVGDFNGDGKDDLAGRRGSGKWWIALSQGNTFNTAYWGKWSTASSWNDVVVGDFNGDGIDDIAGRDNAGQWLNSLSQGNSFQNQAGVQWNSNLNWVAMPVAINSASAAPGTFQQITTASPSASNLEQANTSLVYLAEISAENQTASENSNTETEQEKSASEMTSQTTDTARNELFGDPALLDLLYHI